MRELAKPRGIRPALSHRRLADAAGGSNDARKLKGH
jgi:hypothetical protein